MKDLLKIFIISFFIVACGEMTYSPYEANVDSFKVSDKNLSKLLATKNLKSLAKTYSYKVAVISDTHDYYDGLDKQINYINTKNNFDFVIITGDLSNVGLVSEFLETKKRLDKLTVPYLTTSGNHDLLIDGEKIYERVFGSDTYSFNYQNTKFVLYNNNNWESSSQVPDLYWLEKELTTNDQSYLIVLSHIAPNDPDRFSKSQIDFTRELINKTNVNYYVNGHNHNPGETKFGNAEHVTAGSSSKGVLLELNISNLGVTHEFTNL